MGKELPYVISNKRLPELLSKIQTAAVPDKFTFQFVKKLGFTGSNDRAFPSLLRKIGFLDSTGVPTARYRSYRNKAEAPYVLAEGIREAYSDLFSVNENVYRESKETIKGIVSQVAGVEDRYAALITTTFATFCSLAKFDAPSSANKGISKRDNLESETDSKLKESAINYQARQGTPPTNLTFRYNIEIHLPATTDIAVYNAIFKSLKEHLG